ncbi:MAG: extracellular solute-binding protein [Lachnospiraceae bacterium]|nr:extracellular solute-binding protein [Lachnospiraceae bacterium]
MKNLKRLLALALAGMMTFSLAACNGGGQDGTVSGNDVATNATPGTGTAHYDEDGTRVIRMACWWDRYYDSTCTALEDDPAFVYNDDGSIKPADQMRFDVVAAIEEKYGVRIEWVNLTYEGQIESINNSILAGSPDCDVYLVDLSMGVPAALNGYCTDLRTVLPEDSDIFGDQVVMKYLGLGDDSVCLMQPVAAEATVEATYPLAFNVQMLEDAGLEDPRDLYERGEWTWDKFIEYAQALTVDTDGDGVSDQYGYAGFEQETAMCLIMSNGGVVAGGTEQTLTSPEVGEALQMMYDMYNTYNCCAPYNMEDNTGDSRNLYTAGNIAFWPGAAWIQAGNGDYDYNGALGYTLEFDTAYVAWPVGPSGDAETNAQKLTSGSYYMIPVGIEDPELVYNVFYDYCNYYNGDTSIRDDDQDIHNGSMFWWFCVTGKEDEYRIANYECMFEAGSHEVFDLYMNLGITYDWKSLISGEMTPAQFQETYKQQIQDGLDMYFGG